MLENLPDEGVFGWIFGEFAADFGLILLNQASPLGTIYISCGG
jgi:hypothetical protein